MFAVRMCACCEIVKTVQIVQVVQIAQPTASREASTLIADRANIPTSNWESASASGSTGST
jgi:hypothetical protein